MVRWNSALLVAIVAWGLVLPSRSAYAGDAPSIQEEITAPGWWVVGPFLSGVREAGVDPLAFDSAVGGVSNPLLRPGFPSALVPGGEARWRYYKSGDDGALTVDYPEVTEAGMKLVTDEWGAAGANTVGYAFAAIEVQGGPRRALLDLKHAGSVSINGVPWPGDAYGNGAGTQPVLLQDGRNELKVAIGGDQSFSLKFLPVKDDLIAFTQSATLPDLVRDGRRPNYLGLPVANTTTEWITVSKIDTEAYDQLVDTGFCPVRIPPLCIANLTIPLDVMWMRMSPDLTSDEVTLALNLRYDIGVLSVPLKLAVKDATAPRKVTFVSKMDGSVQYYGLLPPTDFDPKRKYGLILTLHGAGVEAIGQVSAYKPKDWAYVVAPTNRRPFGFDWQDWGQRDMLEVLHDVERTCNIDEDRVHLTGHSMGGHGTWLNALTFPDLWASAAPSAGWTRFDLYAPMFLRRNLLYGDPKANYIWQLAMHQDDTLALCENALNLPIYALEGGADDNVPPQQPRLLVERLKQLGYDITYKEVPGMGHWWDDPATPETDCVDSVELNAFWKSHVRSVYPRQIVFCTANPSLSYSDYWLQIIAPKQARTDCTVRASVSGAEVKIDTINVRCLALGLAPELLGADRGKVVIDGDRIDMKADSQVLAYFAYTSGHWEYLPPGGLAPKDYHPVVAGSWKQVLMQPCTVVIGSAGGAEQTAWNLQLARLYAWQWWYRGNGQIKILPDSDNSIKHYAKNLILIGELDRSSVAAELLAGSPVKTDASGVLVGDRLVSGSDLTYKVIYPCTRWYGSVLVEGGTSLKALKRLAAMQGIYSGAGFPDWMVWDDEVKLKGLGGVLAMGFFDADWNVDPELSYFNEDLINRAK